MRIYFGYRGDLLSFVVFYDGEVIFTRSVTRDDSIEQLYTSLGMWLEQLQSYMLNKQVEISDGEMVILVYNTKVLTTDFRANTVVMERRYYFNELLMVMESLIYPLGLIESRSIDFKLLEEPVEEAFVGVVGFDW